MCRNRRRAGSILSLELLLVLPVLLVLLGGALELAELSAARQRVAFAAREGARAGATGGDRAAVERAVRRALGEKLGRHAAVAADLPVQPGRPVAVEVVLPARVAAPDLLRVIGVNLVERSVRAAAVMRRE